jgi:DNA uptake protein ComE-like DNA-binding protein
MKPTTRRALVILFLLALSMQIIDTFYWDLFPVQDTFSAEYIQEQKRLWQIELAARDSIYDSRLRAFDPNQVDSAFLAEIGVSQSAAKSWLNYLKAGGKLFSEKDLSRLYNMDSQTFQRLIPFADFPKRDRKTWQEVVREEGPLNLKSFNPNTVSDSALEAMGLSISARRGISSFRDKYRPFEAPVDIYKVYGIDSTLASSLEPWLDLPRDTTAELIPFQGVLDLNEADTLALIQVKGIGPARARRIYEWRIRLGGYHRLEQLLWHHIVDSIDLEKVRPYLYCSEEIRYYDLNQSTLEELQEHPYINYYLARNIVDFRERLRDFKKVEELMNIELVDDVLFSKLAPYLKVASDSLN